MTPGPGAKQGRDGAPANDPAADGPAAKGPPADRPVESLEDIPVKLGTPAEPVGAAAGATSTHGTHGTSATTTTAPGEVPLASPASLTELFLAFTWLALQGFGGVLPVAQRELVERRGWLSREQFVEMLAVSQVLPGPNIVNLALMFGDRHFGWRGAVTALVGMLGVPLLVVLALTAAYARWSGIPAVSGALRGMGAVAAGLVVATGFKLLTTLRRNALGLPLGLGLAALMALGSAWLHWPLFGLLLGLGIVACALAWRRLEP